MSKEYDYVCLKCFTPLRFKLDVCKKCSTDKRAGHIKHKVTDYDRAMSAVPNNAELVEFKRVTVKKFSNWSCKLEDVEVIEVILKKNGKLYRTTCAIGGNFNLTDKRH